MMINEKTSLPFKIVVPLAALIIVSTIKVINGVNRVESALEQSWTVNHMEEFARQLQRNNPEISIPDVRQIYRQEPNPKLNLIH